MDLVVSAYAYWPGLPEFAWRVLRPGGVLLVETFSAKHRAATGHPRDASRVPTEDAFVGWEVLHEAHDDRIRLALRKPQIS